MSNLNNSANYNKLPWVGVRDDAGAPQVEFVGNNTILIQGGTRGLEFQLANNANLQIQGFSEHGVYMLDQITIPNGSQNCNLSFNAATVIVGGRIDVQSGAANTNIDVLGRSRLTAQNLDNNNVSSRVYVSGNAVLNVNQGDGNITVGANSSNVETDYSRFVFQQWSNETIEIKGDFNTVDGNGANIELSTNATNNSILGINSVVDNSGNSTNLYRFHNRSCQLLTTTTGYDINNATPTPIQWDTINIINSNVYTVDLVADNTLITMAETGTITVSAYKLNFEGDNNRINLSSYIEINSGENQPTRAYGYTRNNDTDAGTNHITCPLSIPVTAGDTIRLVAIEDNETGFAQVLDAWISLDFIPN